MKQLNSKLAQIKACFLAFIVRSFSTRVKFELELEYETSSIEMTDETFEKGFDEILQLFYDYYRKGIMIRLGEKLIPMTDDFDVSVRVKSICYCDHKIMVGCECD